MQTVRQVIEDLGRFNPEARMEEEGKLREALKKINGFGRSKFGTVDDMTFTELAGYVNETCEEALSTPTDDSLLWEVREALGESKALWDVCGGHGTPVVCKDRARIYYALNLIDKALQLLNGGKDKE